MITSVMYHYIRPIEDSELRYLAVDDFKSQLNWFEDSLGKFLTEADWEEAKAGKPQSGILLTFDDGLKDHFDYVLPILVERGIFGIFFVNTAPIESNCVLPVHLTHKLLSLGKSSEMLEFFQNKVPKTLWRKQDQGILGKRYKKQLELNSNIAIKKIVNYLFSEFDLSEILESAAQKFLTISLNELSSKWYLSEQEIREIDNMGMKIGSHTSTHRLLSKLNRSEIYTELYESKVTLERIVGKTVNEFCYPYGGRDSYNEEVIEILTDLKYSVAHDVYSSKISKINLVNRFKLPRFDCNEFPFGKAHSLKT